MVRNLVYFRMFIKVIQKKNKGYEKQFVSHRLVESYRTAKGPRQRTILSLGQLDLPQEKWKRLADAIEAELSGQQTLLEQDPDIKQLAQHYASQLINKQLIKSADTPAERPELQLETVDLNSVATAQCRSFGAEYVGLATFKKLGLDTLLRNLGLNPEQCNLATATIIGKLVHPGSEHRTRRWLQQLSALDELLEMDFSNLSNNALYRTSDLLFDYRTRIEQHLVRKERSLFSLTEKIILYDLTNTYFESRAPKNPKARRSRSKEKRSDCPLLTLGLVLDEMGFAKMSRIFEGNVAEPKTLETILMELDNGYTNRPADGTKRKVTVVLDAGISPESNLTLLRNKGYDYIVVARNQPVDPSAIDAEQLVTVKKDAKNHVRAQLFRQETETVLYCHSVLKGEKEHQMKTLFQQRLEADLEQAAAALTKKGGTKNYDKVLLRIGRLQEKHCQIARFYQITVEKSDNLASAIRWKMVAPEQTDQFFSGSYFLRTSHTDLTESEIWSLYTMLTEVEDAFRTLKDELALRPIFHQNERRSDGHLFITVLAYHLLHAIRVQLQAKGLHQRWWNIREQLATHVRVTTAMTTADGRRIHLRNTSRPESFHLEIYTALGLNPNPLKPKRTET